MFGKLSAMAIPSNRWLNSKGTFGVYYYPSYFGAGHFGLWWIRFRRISIFRPGSRPAGRGFVNSDGSASATDAYAVTNPGTPNADTPSTYAVADGYTTAARFSASQ